MEAYTSMKELAKFSDEEIFNKTIMLTGVMVNLRTKEAKPKNSKPSKMATFILNLNHEQVDCSVFPSVYKTYSNKLKECVGVVLVGKFKKSGDGVRFIVEKIEKVLDIF